MPAHFRSCVHSTVSRNFRGGHGPALPIYFLRYILTKLIQPKCPTCHLPLTIDLEAPALEIEESTIKARQGILGRLNLESWRSSSKIEALIEELSNLRLQDATTKSIVFSQFVNFLDLIAFRLQKAGFNVNMSAIHIPLNTDFYLRIDLSFGRYDEPSGPRCNDQAF